MRSELCQVSIQTVVHPIGLEPDQQDAFLFIAFVAPCVGDADKPSAQDGRNHRIGLRIVASVGQTPQLIGGLPPAFGLT